MIPAELVGPRPAEKIRPLPDAANGHKLHSVASERSEPETAPSQADYQVRRRLFTGGAAARYRELDIGKWEGLTRDEIERTIGDALRCFDAGNLDVRPGAGENLRELEQRAHSIVNELVGAHPGRRLAVATHLGVIFALLGAFREFDHGDGKGSASTDPGSELDNASWRYLTVD